MTKQELTLRKKELEGGSCHDKAKMLLQDLDVVEVVRCKDCRYCQKVDDMDNGHWECIAHFDLHGRPFLPDLNGFCSYGERRAE